MTRFSNYFLVAITLSRAAFSDIRNVSTGEKLNDALENGAAPLTINFQNDITGGAPQQSFIYPINSSPKFAVDDKNVTINGNSFSLNSGNIPRGLFVHGGNLIIKDLFFGSLVASGGSALSNGGGGAGIGGALFIEKDSNVTLVNCRFSNCSAVGGSVALPPKGLEVTSGGGGLGGVGGISRSSGGGGGSLFQEGGPVGNLPGESGGGGGGVGGAGLAGISGGFGVFIGGPGGGAFDGSNSGLPSGGNGGSGGGGAGGDGFAVNSGDPGGDGGIGGGGGGGGGSSSSAEDGGNGGAGGDFGGGGGGGGAPNRGGNGGHGGFGGGGGPGGNSSLTSGNGGNGGFGGGAGGFGKSSGGTGIPGKKGHGGGDANFKGGGGAGFGGAIFMQADSTDFASLVIKTEAGPLQGNMFQKNLTKGGKGFQNGLSEGPDIFMMSSCLLTFDLKSDVFMSNPIVGDQGAGGGSMTANGLTKLGPALLVLKGPNSYTGTTTIDGGELHVDGNLLTDVTVNAGGVFSGTNTINGNLLNDGGIVSPGATMPNDPGNPKVIGSITITGEFIQTAGKLRADLTPQGESAGDIHDKVVGASKAILAGTLELILDPGNYIGTKQFEVIDAPTNGTKFDSEICTGEFCDKVDFEVIYSSVIVTIMNSVLFEHQNISSGVASDVVTSIKSGPIDPTSDFALMVETLGTLNNKQVNQALIDISAIRFGALEWINARNNSYAADILSQHLFELCCSPRDCCSCDCDGDVWVSVFGNFMDNTKRYDDLPKFSANAGGLLVGMDFCSDNFYYGGAFGYTYTHLIWRNDGGSGKINSYYGALYGSWLCDCFSVDLSVLGGGSDNDLDRRVNFGMVRRTAESDYWGYFVTAHLGLRGSWCWCDNVIEPFAVADYHYYTHETFTEKGANSLNLRVRSNDQHIMRAEAGILSYREFTCECFCYAPYIGVSWVGEFPLHKSVQSASFAGQSGAVHTPTSYDSSVHLGAPQAGMKITSEDGVSLTIGYKGLFNDKTRINEAEVRFDWIF